MVLAALLTLPVFAGSDWAFDDPDESARNAAYDQLRNADADTQADGLKDLDKIYSKELKKYLKEVKSLTAGLPTGDGLERLFANWVDLRDKAFELYMDERLFPFPRGGAVKGPQEGYDKVMPTVNQTTGEYDTKIKKVILGVAKKWMSSKVLQKIEQVEALGMLLLERSQVLTELDPEHEAFTPATFHLVRAVALLGTEEYEASIKIYNSQLTDAEKTAYFFFHAEAINRWNQQNPNGHSKSQLGTLGALNEHRIGLGASPLQASAELHEAITKHEAYCSSTGFAGNPHIGPAGSKTAQERCANAGYRGPVNENLTTASSGYGVATGWRHDGAHYRCMVNPTYQHCGMGNKGMNPGAGMPTAIPSISPPWLPTLFQARQPMRRN
jgi:uncharacterized protein YkwD